MTHPLLVGHFETEGEGVRIRFSTVGGAGPTPIVIRPLIAVDFEAILWEVAGRDLTLASIPRDWKIHFESDGILVGHLYTKNRLAAEFLSRVAERTGATIWDFEGAQRLNPEHFLRSWITRHERLLALAAKRNADRESKAGPAPIT